MFVGMGSDWALSGTRQYHYPMVRIIFKPTTQRQQEVLQ